MRRPWALPLVPLYAAAVAGKNALYDAHVLRPMQLTRPVFSVGSLSAGGAGKTPVVIALAKLLAQHGLSADVLSRGYGRTATTVERVDPGGDPARFGDEPLEIARHGIPVFVGADRHAAGLLAERTSNAAVHVLDDGFQHRRLGRALDLVLLTGEDVRDHLLPAGNLREPLSALRRAQVVILRFEEAEMLRPIVAEHSGAAIWVVRRHLRLAGAPSRPFVFCAIARPAGFLEMLGQAGVAPAGTQAFPDHHRYAAADLDRLCAAARSANADGWIATAKDAVKLSTDARRTLEAIGPITVAELDVLVLDHPTVLPILRRAADAGV